MPPSVDALEPEELIEEWMQSVGDGVAGYQTPKVAVGAVVGNDQGEILLIQRSDSGIWLYPDRVGRHRLLRVGGRGEGGGTRRRGSTARSSGSIGVFDGLRLGFTQHPALLAGVPLPGHRRRA